MGQIRVIRHANLDLRIFGNVYEPAEDSYMLMDAALRMVSKDRPKRVLEIGTGCGLIAIGMSKAGCPLVVATDISHDAIRCAQSNISSLAPRVRLLLADLFEGIVGAFDLILFNPPYLPVAGPDEDVSWAGGPDGRVLIDRYLMGLPQHLLPGGAALLVQSSFNDMDTTHALAEKLGLRTEVVAEKAFFFERLYVVSIHW